MVTKAWFNFFLDGGADPKKADKNAPNPHAEEGGDNFDHLVAFEEEEEKEEKGNLLTCVASPQVKIKHVMTTCRLKSFFDNVFILLIMQPYLQ